MPEKLTDEEAVDLARRKAQINRCLWHIMHNVTCLTIPVSEYLSAILPNRPAFCTHMTRWIR